MAGILIGFKAACLYITLTDNFLVRILFQRLESPTFHYAGFLFQLLHSEPDDDLYLYKITKENFSMKVFDFVLVSTKIVGPSQM